jgi:hypothetical protein
MRLPNFEQALTKRAGSVERLWAILQERGEDSFTIHEKPYLPFAVDTHWEDAHVTIWAFFHKEVNGDTCMDPLVKYRCTRTADGSLDFVPFYWETWPFPPCEVIEEEGNIAGGTIRRAELEQFVAEWDAEFGKRGYVEKTPPIGH